MNGRRLVGNLERLEIVLVIILSWCPVCPAAEKLANDENVPTFNQHVASIVHEKCASCHRPGQTGPFSLIDYKDVARRSETIMAVIESGYMPPWKPVNHNIAYRNDRRLTKAEKAILKKWIEGGKPPGPGRPPTPQKFADGWSLGEPDMVVDMVGAYEVPASGPDVYRSFVFPVKLAKDKWIKAIEYRPTAKRAVHHAIFFIDRDGNARKLDGADGKPGIEGMEFLAGGPLQMNDAKSGSEKLQGLLSRFRRSTVAGGHSNAVGEDFAKRVSLGLGGYAPGTTPTLLPDDLAYFLPKGSDIVMQTHFHPSGKVETEKGRIAIYFADRPPSKTMVPIQIPAMFGLGVGLRVPAGEENYRVTESMTLPVDVQLVSIGAHAHYICTQASMVARLPDGRSATLLEIDDWDLDWQDRYYFKDQITLPAGTVLTAELVYDNSTANPENPNYPPQEIRWGRQSGDEMGSVSIMAVAAKRRTTGRTVFRIAAVCGEVADTG